MDDFLIYIHKYAHLYSKLNTLTAQKHRSESVGARKVLLIKF